MSPKSACPTPPCFTTVPFLDWCNRNAALVGSIACDWHDRSPRYSGLYLSSHFIALDPAGDPARCATMTWPEPRSLGTVESFRVQLQSLISQKNQG